MTKTGSRMIQGTRTTARPRSRAAYRRSSWKKRVKTAAVLLLLIAESAVAMSLVIAVVVFWKFSNSLPKIEDMRQGTRAPIATTIWSEDGVLLGTLQVENRHPITLGEMPRTLLNATVAIEDHRYYEHPGVDVQGIARATVANFAGSNATRQGASTLTQQLVRNMDQFGLTKEKKFSRKIREALTALRLEQLYSKNEILTLYLNNIYYGAGAYGVQAASRTYFGKSAYKLDLAESALLAGLPQRPSSFTPFDHRKAAIKRRDEVLENMFKYHFITLAQLDAAKAEVPRLMPPQKHKDYNFKAPYFVWHVLSGLIRHYGSDHVYSGLKIETTLNWKMQQWAEQELENGLKNHNDGPNQGAMVALDNNTGYIRALVGGRNYRASQYNNVTMGRRQPGSTFKLFDYAAAFDTGACDLYDSFVDKPIPYPNDPTKIVKNFSEDGGYSYSNISCKTAIQFSKNTVAVQVAAKVGIDKVIDYAHRMGISTPLQRVLPTALGASEVHPLDLASAYSVLPLKGRRHVPMAVVRVFGRDGNIEEEHAPETQLEMILKPRTVEQMDEALEAVVTAGSGTKAREDSQGNIVENAHGKTGTTSDSRDAWFAGYTPELTTVVWVAQVHHFNQKHPTWPTYMPMGGVTGGAICAPIWHDFMMKAVPVQRKFHLPGFAIIAAAPTPSTSSKAADEPQPIRHRHKKHSDAKPVLPNATTKPTQPGTVPELPPVEGTTGDGSTPVNKPEPPDISPKQQDNGNNEEKPSQPAPPAPMVKAGGQPRLRPLASVGLTAMPSPRLSPSHAASPIHTEPIHSEQARSVPTPRPSAPPRSELPRPAAPVEVTVTVCAETGDRANTWCTVTKTTKMSAKQASQLRRCRLHKPQPGEG